MSTTIERFDSWDDDDIIIEIAKIAERRARKIAGTWKVAVSSLHALVCRMVRRRAIDSLRRSQRSDSRNAEHARERREGAHVRITPVRGGIAAGLSFRLR